MAKLPTAPANINRKGLATGYPRTAAALKQNEIVAANLTLAMSSVPKWLLGAYAATVLDTAIRTTKHDSGRFAANWNLAIGNEPLLNGGNPLPLLYGESGPSFGSIGTKGDDRFRVGVMMAKRAYYGYTKDSGEMMKLTRGRLAEALFPRTQGKVQGSGILRGLWLSAVEKLGAAPKIFLYNPFMRPEYVPFRKSGWNPLHGDTRLRTGETYPYYALPKGGTQEISRETASLMGHGFLQERIAHLAAAMRTANVNHTIMDPF